VALTIRPLDPRAELPAYLAVSNQPHAMPLTEAGWWDAQARVRPDRPGWHLVAEHDGRIVAIATVRDSAMTRDTLDVRVVVDRDERGRGFGRAVAAAAAEHLRSRPAATLVGIVREDDPASRAWVERRGFVLFDHTFESRLDLDGFDAAPHRWALERATAAGLAIEPSADADRLYELVVALTADVPAAALDPTPRDEFQEHVVGRTGAFSLVARDGADVVGLAIVVPVNEDGAWNWLTGVTRDHRGHGLARALKVAAAEEARRRGRRWMGTQNDVENAPMLAVNDALGFVRQSGLLWLRRPGLTGMSARAAAPPESRGAGASPVA
jgi:GNAT superfamily N-acetyltransferase